MANSSGLRLKLIFTLFAALMISSSATVPLAADNWMPTKQGCTGTIAECMAGGVEFDMDSESTRRILATNNYISYGALQRNTVPCSRRGASYYNCKPGAEANPYSRGCSAITRCRS